MQALNRAFAAAVGAALSLAGCQMLNSESDVAAVIVDPDASSRAALQEAVNDALGTEVTLAVDALTRSSLLPIEHDPPGRIDAPPAQGRILDRPLQFRLVKRGDQCILIDQRDQSRHVLRDTRCAAEDR